MDRLTPEQRKKCMQSNKSKGTKPELALAKAMWALGLRYRKN
ncbi:very short patch repair endonuclease, partial [Neisseria meningitidis]|nr:very short patch repair endonuclease [Neisseria meningitidis]